jgi:hypothetical protein
LSTYNAAVTQVLGEEYVQAAEAPAGLGGHEGSPARRRAFVRD